MTADKPTRSLSLDAVRGVAILGMMLSGVVPWEGLPGWMYHGQEPPPSHEFNAAHPGITWVDLVFPFFLFALGAAIPLAPRRPWWGAIQRGGSLVVFAILIQHIRPWTLAESPSTTTWLLSATGFAISILVFARIPRSWPQWSTPVARVVGLALMAGLLSQCRYPDGTGFQLQRSDIIILILASMAVLGSVLWSLTAERPLMRGYIILALAAMHLTASVPGSLGHSIYGLNSWVANGDFLPYLIPVLIGTYFGDQLRASVEGPSNRVAAWLALAMIPVMLALFYLRLSPLWALPLGGLLWTIVNKDNTIQGRFIRSGLLILLLGSLLEPLEGGIKKDPKTLSYLLATPGLAALMLAAWIPFEKSRVTSWVAQCGQNPMLAYAAIAAFIGPIWALTVGDWFNEHTQGPALGMVRALLQTLLLGGFVVWMTRRGVQFRA